MVSKERNLENAAFAWECMWRLSGHKCKRKPQGKRTSIYLQCSCYQDKGSALPLRDSDLDTPRWLLEWMTDMSNKGLYLGVCFQIEHIPQLPAAKIIVLSEVVSNQKQFKFMQKYSEIYHLYPRMKRQVLMTTCSSLKCMVEVLKVCRD